MTVGGRWKTWALIASLAFNAAFLAGLLTMSFGLAGVAGVNPVFFLFEVLLILAWRNAGAIGLDRFLLPAVGTPWEPGAVFQQVPATHGEAA